MANNTEECHWITIKGHGSPLKGRHLCINDAGVIAYGAVPKDMWGKTLAELGHAGSIKPAAPHHADSVQQEWDLDSLWEKQSQLVDVMDPHSQRESTAQTKARIQHELLMRLRYDKDFQAVADYLLPMAIRTTNDPLLMNSNYQDYMNAVHENPLRIASLAVEYLIGEWAISSADHNDVSIAMQFAAMQEFRIPHAYLSYDATAIHDGLRQFRGQRMRGLRKFLRAMYDNTQEWFQKNGIKEVPLMRGAQWDEDEMPTPAEIKAIAKSGIQSDVIKLQPMSSFTTLMSTALNFASSEEDIYDSDLVESDDYDDEASEALAYNYYSMLTATTVPVERIIGTCQTGYGCKSEHEMVVLGGHLSAGVLAWHGSTPDYSHIDFSNPDSVAVALLNKAANREMPVPAVT